MRWVVGRWVVGVGGRDKQKQKLRRLRLRTFTDVALGHSGQWRKGKRVGAAIA